MRDKDVPLAPRSRTAPVIYQAELFPADGSKTLRWRDRHHSWQRVEGERFNASRYHVVAVKIKEVSEECAAEAAEKEEKDQVTENGGQAEAEVIESGSADVAEEKKMTAEERARAFVKQHHYSGTCSVASQIYGLYEEDELIGVAILGIPPGRLVLPSVFPDLVPYTQCLELSRFVLLDRAPANSESWFLARVWELAARTDLCGIVSFSDPVIRLNADGVPICPGHVGTIYQAANATYLGKSQARNFYQLPDGQLLHPRMLQKIKKGDKGWQYAEKRLVLAGARPRLASEDPSVWLQQALREAGAFTIRHSGLHRYAFRIGERRRFIRLGKPSYPYPKRDSPDLTYPSIHNPSA